MSFDDDFPSLIEDGRGLIQERNEVMMPPDSPILVAFPPAAIVDCCLDKQRVCEAIESAEGAVVRNFKRYHFNTAFRDGLGAVIHEINKRLGL